LYTAKWCAPCKQFKKSHWPALKAEFPAVKFLLVDIERSEVDESITSIPTVRVQCDGHILRTFKRVLDEVDLLRECLAASVA
jgi:thiol-disulfide isomerase/thioredoxin